MPYPTHPYSKRKGFTLLEILLVVAAIAILAGIVIVAVNPAQQLAQVRDAQRRSDVNALSQAIAQYTLKNNGVPSTLVVSASETCTGKTYSGQYGICKEGVSCAGTSLDALSADRNYLVSLPNDPTGTDASFTGYVAFKYSTNRVMVCAPFAEATTTISAIR